mmetsp:Transcript_14199/g.29427  ORF Transcript_14199/g.29427 Transcript_14199/m.29427 type:complete len:263 (-) Transcript_14199:3-791(-)
MNAFPESLGQPHGRRSLGHFEQVPSEEHGVGVAKLIEHALRCPPASHRISVCECLLDVACKSNALGIREGSGPELDAFLWAFAAHDDDVLGRLHPGVHQILGVCQLPHQEATTLVLPLFQDARGRMYSGEHDDRFVEDLGLLVEIVEEADYLLPNGLAFLMEHHEHCQPGVPFQEFQVRCGTRCLVAHHSLQATHFDVAVLAYLADHGIHLKRGDALCCSPLRSTCRLGQKPSPVHTGLMQKKGFSRFSRMLRFVKICFQEL